MWRVDTLGALVRYPTFASITSPLTLIAVFDTEHPLTTDGEFSGEEEDPDEVEEGADGVHWNVEGGAEGVHCKACVSTPACACLRGETAGVLWPLGPGVHSADERGELFSEVVALLSLR